MSTPTKEPARHQGTGDGDHRNNIFEFFRSQTAFDMLPESGKVCLLDSSLSAYAALSIMAANQQLAAPVWDGMSDSYMGMLTVTDLVEMVLACGSSKAYSSCQEGLRALTLEDWMCHHPRPHGCPLPSVEVRPDDDLMHVLWTLVRNNCRVVPVLEREGARKDTAMLNQCLVGQISYLLLFRFLFYHQSTELETLEGTLLDVGIGTFAADQMFTAKATDGVRTALELMSHKGISGVPVVDDDNRLVGIFCDADILMYTPEFLSLDLGTALKQVSTDLSGKRRYGQWPREDPEQKVQTRMTALQIVPNAAVAAMIRSDLGRLISEVDGLQNCGIKVQSVQDDKTCMYFTRRQSGGCCNLDRPLQISGWLWDACTLNRIPKNTIAAVPVARLRDSKFSEACVE